MKFRTNLSTVEKWLPTVLLVLLLLIAAALRFYKIDSHGLAGDEKYSVYVSQFVVIEGGEEPNAIKDAAYFTPKQFWADVKPHHFFESIARLDTGNGAFYTLSLRLWMNVFGNSDASARSLSVVFNLLTIFLLYIFVAEFFNNRFLALLVVFLSTISPFFISFSQVARNYAMLFFFALAATYLLLRLIRKYRLGQRFQIELVLYGFTALICLLCHISTAVLFVVHGFFVLIYFREKNLIISLLLTAIIPVVGMALWLSSEGGKWMFEYVANSVRTYNYLAENNPEEYLKIATPATVFTQMQYVVSCLFITAEGLYRELNGFKNAGIAIFATLVLITNQLWVKNERLQLVFSMLILIVSYLLFSIAKVNFLILIGNFFCLFLFIWYLRHRKFETEEKTLGLVLLIIILGLLFLIIFAFQDGNTFRLMPRYVGYIYPFATLFVALIIYQTYQNFSFKYSWLVVLGATHLFFISGIINDIYRDNPPRYFMQFYEPRHGNPYREIAEMLSQKVAKSDTVIYPSFSQRLYGGKDEAKYSIADAQLINIYLPKNSTIIQRIDRSEPDKVILKHADGSQEILFDFEGIKYRY